MAVQVKFVAFFKEVGKPYMAVMVTLVPLLSRLQIIVALGTVTSSPSC